MRITPITTLAILFAASTVARTSAAQRCAPTQTDGIVISQGHGLWPDAALSAQGLVVAWQQESAVAERLAYDGWVRAIDPATLRPRGAARRVVSAPRRDGSATAPRLAVMDDGRIVVSACTCANRTASCTSTTVAGTTPMAALVASSTEPAVCSAAPFDAAASATNLLTVTPFGAPRALRFAGTAAAPQPDLASPGASEVVELVPLAAERFALVRSQYNQALTAQLVDARGALRGPAVELAAASARSAAPLVIPWGAGLATITWEQRRESEPTSHRWITWTPGGAATSATLELPRVRVSSSRYAVTQIEALAPSRAGCVLVGWQSIGNTDLSIGRVCNGALDASSVGVLHRQHGIAAPRLLSDGQRAFVVWSDDTRGGRESIRVAQLGCSSNGAQRVRTLSSMSIAVLYGGRIAMSALFTRA